MKPGLKSLRTVAAITLVAIVIIGMTLVSKEESVPKKIMMYYGGPDIEEMFDATSWFTSGMYKPRNIEADGSASAVTMLRTQPMKLTSQQLNDLPFIAAGSFFSNELMTPEREDYFTSQPNLSQRYRYTYSAFAEPNVPEDYYDLFLEIANKRFVVTFSVDAQKGGELTGRYAEPVSADQPADADYIRVFAEIAEAERKAN